MWWKFRRAARSAEEEEPSEQASEIRAAGRAPLSDVARRVKRVELITHKKSAAQLSGEYKSRFKGQGMQFSDSRLYQYGDDIRHIDWRTTARMQEAYVKTFEEERELNILFAVDVSASGSFGSTGYNKRETLALALASLGFSAIANSDRVGLLLFTDVVERFVPPRKGRKHILRVIDELLTFTPLSKKSDMGPALTFLAATLKHGSVLVLAGDFFTKLDRRKIQLLARKHDLICLRASDPRDAELPDVGLLRVEDPETGETQLLSTGSAAIRSAYAASQKSLLAKTTTLLEKAGAALVHVPTGADPSGALREFFTRRRRPRR